MVIQNLETVSLLLEHFCHLFTTSEVPFTVKILKLNVEIVISGAAPLHFRYWYELMLKLALAQVIR